MGNTLVMVASPEKSNLQTSNNMLQVSTVPILFFSLNICDA